MSDDAPLNDSPRRRFRFGLKHAFIIMTLLCVWLGVKVARERRADEMIARRHAVYNTLLKNMSKPFMDARIEFAPRLLRHTNSTFRKDWILGTGASRSYETDELELTLGPTIASLPADKIVREIADHVGLGLNECGLYNEGGLTESFGPAVQYIGSWQQDSKSEFTVIIEVVAEPAQSKSAMVWVAVIENQLLSHWNLPTLSNVGITPVALFLFIIWIAIRQRRAFAPRKK